MWKIIPYAILQSALLCGGQVFLKFALMRMPSFSWTRAFWASVLTNWQFAACGVCFGLASLLWMYIVKWYPFSTAYPMVSLSYVFGMLAAIMFFHEEVPMVKWIGVGCIVVGCFLIASPASGRTVQGVDGKTVKHSGFQGGDGKTVKHSGLVDEKVKTAISQAARNLKTMQCDFVQTKHLKLLKNDLVSKGKMYYQPNDKLRWEYITPYSYTFILNGDKVLLKNKKRSDVIDVNQNKLFREIARIMMNSVVGSCLSDDKSFKTSLSVSGTEWIATMTPLRKEMKQMFQKIILHFSKEKSTVTQVELIEKNGDTTHIELKNIVVNEAIGAKMFVVH
jgi:outer membrane lipoprotein carrier protein